MGQYSYTISHIIEQFKGKRIILVHSTSLNNKSTKNIHVHDNVELIDLSYKNVTNLFKTISFYKPILFIAGHNSLIEFVLSNYFYTKRLKSIYLQHGYFLEKAYKFYISNYITAIKKYFIYLIAYFYTLLRDPINVFSNFFLYLKYKSEISFCDINLFYNEDSVRKLKCRGKKIVIGYPLGENIYYKNIIKKSATIIHQCFIHDNLSSITFDQEKKYFIELIKLLIEKKFRKINFLVHPRDDYNKYLYLKDLKVNVYQGIKYQEKIFESELIIGHYSSLIFQCIEIGKSVIRIKYPGINNNFSNKGAYSIEKIKSNEDIFKYNSHNINQTNSQYVDYKTYAKKVIKYVKIDKFL